MWPETLHLSVHLPLAEFDLSVAGDWPLEGCTALFGPSGAGKSTLLRLIAGFVRPRAGRVALGRTVWADTAMRRHVPPHRRRVGLLFQDARLFPHLTVAGNLAYADRRGRPAGDGPERSAVVEAFDLAPLLTRSVRDLSGGERQRVALGRTLLTRPELLLLDEPLAALDAQRKRQIVPYLDQVWSRFSVPSLLVSHDVAEVARLADRTVVMSAGQAVAVGATADILERLDLQPLTGRFEAGVVVDGMLVSRDPAFATAEVAVAGHRVSMPDVPDLALGETLRLRIRARDVALARQAPEATSIRNILHGTVAWIDSEADTAFAEVGVDIGGLRLRARITRAAVADLALSPGVAVYALIKSISFDRRLL